MVQTNVFTARFLQSLYQPGITYSDKGICGGAYKNGGEEADDEKAREELENHSLLVGVLSTTTMSP